MKFILLVLIILVGWGVYRNSTPKGIGLQNGHLASCPNSPNCVNSEATDEVHAIAPLPAPEGAKSFEKLKKIISEIPEAEIITNSDNYLHAEFTSKMMRFVDDVEFHFTGNVIHVRSASRVGYGDMGVNRARIENIRSRYLE